MTDFPDLLGSLDDQEKQKQADQAKAEQLDAVNSSTDKVVKAVDKTTEGLNSVKGEVKVTNPDLAKSQDVNQAVEAINKLNLTTFMQNEGLPQLADNISQLSSKTQDLQDKLENEGLKKMGDQLSAVVAKLDEVAKVISKTEVSVDSKLQKTIDNLSKSIDSIDFSPSVNVSAPDTKVVTIPIDLSSVIKALGRVEQAVNDSEIPETKLDLSPVISGLSSVQNAIQALRFPVPNYVLPFQTQTGKDVQVKLNDDGSLPITASISTGALATAANQTNGTQLTQIVDAGGEAATVTGGKLDVNATASLAGTNLPISGATTAVGVAIVDSSGNQISSFGGGTQYTDAGTPPAHPIGGTLEWNNAGTWATVGSASPLPVSLASVPSHAVTNAGTFAVQASQSGTWNIGTVTALTGITNALPAGSNVIGHVITDTGSTTAVTGTVAVTQSTSPWVIGGNVASGATDSGNPVKVGGVNNTTQPTLTDGQRGDLQTDTRANLKTVLYANNTTTTASFNADNADAVAVSATANKLVVLNRNSVYNGTTWDRLPGDTTGVSIKDGGNSITVDNGGTFAAQATLQTQTDTVMVGGVNIKEINAVTPLMGNGVSGTGSQRVTIASDNTAFAVNSTLSAETTKVIGVTRTSDGTGNLLTSNSTTYTAKFGLDANLLGTLGTAFSTAGKVDVKAADGDVFVRQTTAANLNMTEVSAASILTSVQLIDDTITAQGTALGSTKTSLVGGSVTTNAPTFTTGQINQLSLTTAGGLRVDLKDSASNTNAFKVDGSATTQPVSIAGTVVVDDLAAAATGAAVPANAQYQGNLAKTSLPSAASDGNLTGNMSDKYGRSVVLNNAMRDIMGTQTTTITASTSETTIITQIASTFNDLVSVFISNTSATAARVDIRDTTAGSVIFQLYIPAGDMRGLSLTTPWPQTTVNTNWTAQSSTSVTDLRVSCLYIKNK